MNSRRPRGKVNGALARRGNAVSAASSASSSGLASAPSSAASSAVLSSASRSGPMNVAEEQKFVPPPDDPIPAPAPLAPAPPLASAAVFPPQAPVFEPVNPALALVPVAAGGMEFAPGRRFVGFGGLFGTLVRTLIRSVMDAIGVVIVLLKVPFILFLVAYSSLHLLGYVVDTASESLAPVCTLFPKMPLCRVTAAADNLSVTLGNVGRKPTSHVHRVDFPGLMALQSCTLDQLLAQSTSGCQLALTVKQAELAVKDLGIIVKASNLTSKDVLAQALEEFALEAKLAGRDLQQLSAKLYGTVDTVLAFDDYALRSIASATTSGTDVRDTAVAMFRSTMTALASEVARVILDATTLASTLDALEEKLSIIRSLSEQEMVLTKSTLSDVLSELWTVLGGNKDKLHHLSNQVDILRNVDWYRTLSVAHVVATTEVLLSLEAELSELRDKLSTPELTGETIPIEVQIASIERGVRRIKEQKLKTRELVRQGSDGVSGSSRASGGQGLLGGV